MVNYIAWWLPVIRQYADWWLPVIQKLFTIIVHDIGMWLPQWVIAGY